MFLPVRTAVLWLLLFFTCLVPIFAQETIPTTRSPWSVGGNAYYGALFRYRKDLPLLNFTNPYSIELFANKHTIGKRPWESKFKYPQIGFALAYYNYGAPDELGEAFALTTSLGNTLAQGKRHSLKLNLGTGLVYSTRHYTPVTNEQNIAIGSAISFALQSTLQYEVPVSERVYLNLNLAFRHFSNGGLNKPNNGMNFPLLGMGLRYQPSEVVITEAPIEAPAVPNTGLRLNLRVAAGVKEVLRIDTKHPVYSASAYASKRLTQTNTFLLGADAFHDSSLREEFLNQHMPPPETAPDPRMAGITIGHELHLDRLSIVVQLGRYVHQPHRLFPNYYQRYGFKYNLTNHLSVNAMLMAHTKSANVIEWGLGFHL